MPQVVGVCCWVEKLKSVVGVIFHGLDSLLMISKKAPNAKELVYLSNDIYH